MKLTKHNLTFVFILIHTLSFAQGKYRAFEDDGQDFKGNKIRRMIEYRYDAKGTADSIIRGKYEGRDSSNFDNKGRRISTYNYNTKGQLLTIAKFTFNAKDQLAEVKCISFPTTQLDFTQKDVYNLKGHLSERYMYDGWGKLLITTFYKTDSFGNIIYSAQYSKSEKKPYKITNRSYNNAYDTMMESSTYFEKDPPRSWLDDSNMTTYNNLDQVNSYTDFLNTNTHLSSYNELGLCTKSLCYNFEGKIYWETIYTYPVLDKHNNWLKKITFDEKTPKGITIRKFVYAP